MKTKLILASLCSTMLLASCGNVRIVSRQERDAELAAESSLAQELEDSRAEEETAEETEAEEEVEAVINPGADVVIEDYIYGETILADENRQVVIEGQTQPNTVLGVVITYQNNEYINKIVADEDGEFSNTLTGLPAYEYVTVRYYTDLTMDEDGIVQVNPQALPAYELYIYNEYPAQEEVSAGPGFGDQTPPSQTQPLPAE